MVQNVKKEEQDLFPDDDDDYIFHTAAAVEEEEGEEKEVDMFPDDDDDILFTDMSGPPAVPTEPTTATTTTRTRTEQQQQGQRQVKISGTAAAAAVHTIERPFTYLSSHLRKRASNVKCQQESICVKVGRAEPNKFNQCCCFRRLWLISVVVIGTVGVRVDHHGQVGGDEIGDGRHPVATIGRHQRWIGRIESRFQSTSESEFILTFHFLLFVYLTDLFSPLHSRGPGGADWTFPCSAEINDGRRR